MKIIRIFFFFTTIKTVNVYDSACISEKDFSMPNSLSFQELIVCQCKNIIYNNMSHYIFLLYTLECTSNSPQHLLLTRFLGGRAKMASCHFTYSNITV